jgi:hypothetical protein
MLNRYELDPMSSLSEFLRAILCQIQECLETK